MNKEYLKPPPPRYRLGMLPLINSLHVKVRDPFTPNIFPLLGSTPWDSFIEAMEILVDSLGSLTGKFIIPMLVGRFSVQKAINLKNLQV